MDSGKHQFNASVQLAHDIGDTVKRIDGTEVPLLAPWGQGAPTSGVKSTPAPKPAAKAAKPAAKAAKTAKPAKAAPAKTAKPAAKAAPKAAPKTTAAPAGEAKPRTMKAPRKSGADDLQRISGVGPKLETTLNEMGFWHFDQIAKWGAGEIAWVDSRLKFKGRIERDDWVAQAGAFAAEG
jgi:NADH-quinone oxidoreductase subunit E